MSIFFNIKKLENDLPQNVKLVAVSKYHTVEAIQEAYNAGQRLFGESRLQELTLKKKVLSEDIVWHFIGHLQRNKVKEVIKIADVIESIDSFKLLEEVQRQCDSLDISIKCMLQIHISDEATKYGFSYADCEALLKNDFHKKSDKVTIIGLMGMASNTPDQNLIRNEFRTLKQFYDRLKNNYFQTEESFNELSMGMSGDYFQAIEEGTSMIRLGSLIFGER